MSVKSGVRLLAALQGDLSKMMAQELNSARVAVTTGVREATQGLKSELRSQIEGSGLGSRLANTWRRRCTRRDAPAWVRRGLCTAARLLSLRRTTKVR